MKTRISVIALTLAIAASFAAAQAPRTRAARPRKAIASQPALADAFAGAQNEVYRKIGGIELKLHIFSPPGHKPADRRPAIVFFFGGGWLRGSAGQFVPQCRYLASRGMVAITADYRVYERDQAKVADCVSDAQAAVRWLRANAKRLGIDPERIAAGGGSAGGHLAAATAMLKDFTGDKDTAVSFRPNALVLFNPALDLTPIAENEKRAARWRDRLGASVKDLSPAVHVKPDMPPTIIFHGKADNLIAYANMEAFVKAMKTAGNRCELVGFEGQGHGFFNDRPGGNEYYDETLRLADRFLASLGYVTGTFNDWKTAVLAAKPGVKVVLSETGWPVAGVWYRDAQGKVEGSPAMAKDFFDKIRAWSDAQGVEVYYFEAISEPYKSNKNWTPQDGPWPGFPGSPPGPQQRVDGAEGHFGAWHYTTANANGGFVADFVVSAASETPSSSGTPAGGLCPFAGLSMLAFTLVAGCWVERRGRAHA